MSRTYRILIVAVVALAAAGGYWKLLLAPKRAQAGELEQKIAFQQAQLGQTQSLIATYKGARDDYKANYATVVRLGKAVPSDDDTRSLIVQLDAAARRSGVDFDTLNVNGGGTSTGADAPVAPGAINTGAYSAMPFSFGFSGTFSTLGNFFARLERFVSVKGDQIEVNGRLLRVENISLAPGAGGWPALTAQVGASSYIVPRTQAAAAATPSAGTSTATSAGTTASSGSNLR